jgi:pimeloyl-ACP methyl ester carboxylesterase
VDDAKIYYETYGNGGRPLVLLHGDVYGYINEFAALITKMSKTRKVIAIATRGHGRSELGKQPLSYDLFAKDAAAVIRHETKEKVDVLGFSGGATTSYLLAAKHPEMVNRLVAIGGALGNKTRTPELIEKAKHFDAAQFNRDNAGFSAQRKTLMPAPELWDDFLRGMAKLDTVEVLVTPEQLRAIDMPTLIVVGDRDEFNRIEAFVELYKLLPRGQLAVVPGCGHVVFARKPALMISIVSEFLR